MRRFLIDTTPLAAFLSNRPAVVGLVAPRFIARELGTSIMVYGEVLESLKAHPEFDRRHAALRALPRYPTMERYADLCRRLRPPHGQEPIGDIDTVIAATAAKPKGGSMAAPHCWSRP